jgi:glutamyl-tRNA synthetase
VTWDDLVKGPITINNREIDDLIIVRDDGIPTYNFAVVVDDWDMRISHVFRGDEHINNTPWQINMFRALRAACPKFGHLPIILGDDGQKLSKRRGAVSVTAYEDNGYLPEAMLNYLARLGWSHGDDELFTREQMVSWFDGSHLSKSPAQWDATKLAWVNAQYMKQADDARLAALVAAQFDRRASDAQALADAAAQAGPARMAARCALFKDRCSTTAELADWLAMFVVDVKPSQADLDQHVTEPAKAALRTLCEKLETVEWSKPALAAAMKETLAAHGIKMPQLAIPLRVLLCGRAQTPDIAAVLELFSRDIVVSRLRAVQ